MTEKLLTGTLSLNTNKTMAAKDGPKVSVTMKNIIFDLSDQGCSSVKICKTLQQEFD